MGKWTNCPLPPFSRRNIMTKVLFINDTKYSIEQDIEIADKHYIFASNCKNKEFFIVANLHSFGNYKWYDNILVMRDYLTAISEWNTRIQSAINNLRYEKKDTLLGDEDVNPITDDEDINNKILVIKPIALKRELRFAQQQLYLCIGGLGANEFTYGHSILCRNIFTDKISIFKRSDVCGTIINEKMPSWAFSKINSIQTQNNKPIIA